MRRRELYNRLVEEYTPNVYWNPPENFKMSYPCIIYSLVDTNDIYADNKKAIYNEVYELTWISFDKEDLKLDKLMHDDHATYNSYFLSDAMHHYKFRYVMI